MCGIAGVLDLNGRAVPQPLLRKMCDAIAHRGPDGEGYYVDGPVALGHRRLAIIDLSPAAHQPMLTPDKRFCLSYNGEVYNFQVLRLELEALGHTFHSQTDSEVILKAYAQWGLDSIEKFNGMFAFAIWDKEQRTLILARDRFGVKPLYYTVTGDTVLFGSEIKAILAHPNYQAKLDHEGLYEYMSFQNYLSQKTLYKGVEILPAGHFATVNLQDRQFKLHKYWDYRFHDDGKSHDHREYLEELERLFQQAVQRQLVSDVEVGSYLSGGMDSGSITAVASRAIPNMKTFTVGFDLSSASGMELAFDERGRAEAMSYAFKTEQYEMVLKAGDMERIMPRLGYHLEEPRVGQSYPNFFAAQLASKFCKVVLAGTGGDELFGGYPWRYYGAVVNEDVNHYLSKYFKVWQRLLTDSEQKSLFSPVRKEVEHVDPFAIFKSVYPQEMRSKTKLSPEEYLDWSLYFEAKTFLHGLLVVEDKISMAHSMETRVPFLDNDLVDFAMKLPASMKLGNFAAVVALDELEPGERTKKYFQKTKDGKMLLREAMSRIIDKKITEAKKQGFSGPDASWFKGESIDYVQKTLTSERSRLFEVFDRKTVLDLVNVHVSGKENRRLVIWSLLSIHHFLQSM